MGLGKTIQAIAVAYMYKAEWPLLIVVPSSLKYPWIEEIEKWIPELNPEDVNLIDNKTDIGRIQTSKVTILGYGLLTTDARMLIDALCEQHFQVVIVDESHYMKSRNAARSTILAPIVQKAARAVLLTGTPALGRPEELFMQIDALYPRKFGTWSEYSKKYCNAHVRYFGKRAQWDCKGASNLDELHLCLSKIMIRRMKDEVLTQLPPKVRQRIPFDLGKDASKEMNASIEEWEKLMRKLHSCSTETDNPFIQVMGLITHMYKQTAIAKAGAVKDYIKMMLQNEKLKFLVFAYHLSMLQACTEAVIENKVGYIRIDGSVPSSERIHLVHQFQNDPDKRVAILSIKAAGQGLTFTAATHVVFAELYWDPGHLVQAEDRAHRIGQSSSVHIHYLVAKETMDTFMWSMLNRKTCVTSNTLNGTKKSLEIEEADNEQWDFLNAAMAWVPNDNLQGSQDEMFFTHFEKEKQHDIRSFFSSKRDPAEKRKRTPYKLASIKSSDLFELQELTDSPKAIQHPQEQLSGKEPGKKDIDEAKSQINDAERLLETDFEPQTKRFKSSSMLVRNEARMKKRMSEGGKKPSPRRVQGTQRLLEDAQLPKKLCENEKWNCSACTYANNSLMPYCEMCDVPRDDGDEKENSLAQDKNPEEKESEGRSQTDCIVLSDIEGEPKELYTAPRHFNREMMSSSEEISADTVPVNMNESSNTVPVEENVDNESAKQPEKVDIPCDNNIPVYDGFAYCASKHTDRVYLYTKETEPLNSNFIPLDVKLENWEDLPEIFQQKKNYAVVLRFVREWFSLSAMKQKLIRKSGQIFCSPILAFESITKEQRRQSCTKRFLTKEDVAAGSLNKARSESGSVRVIAKDSAFFGKNKTKSNPATGENLSKNSVNSEKTDCDSLSTLLKADEISLQIGYIQAVNHEGKPLCLACQEPTIQISKPHDSTDWDTRFCSPKCQEDFLIRSNGSYMRSKVFEVEHGICQQCKLNAHELYLTVKDAPKALRKKRLQSIWLAQLSLDQLNEIIQNPSEGQFWQVDHIKPVYGGGGQCSLVNLQTLCTVCHKERTAKQARERSEAKRLSSALKFGSDITRFFVKK
ncbi:DNA annealing helicase and endonuclease ZRANB3 isoform X3 [Callorhinchus milii]|nr:DNA annealing helicase and endonuclease ZRANB3 isoform X3 [Callorhinchus milii]|eukprot:gi/632957276/ref/XP_007894390.1/ PREDICTED: DNA annealing helicase and endonuclease ZRANB3 isoform X3 [Callorhinchus milii]